MNKHDLILACLAEECGEVIQAVGKALRFGRDAYHPIEKIPNHTLIYKEVHDVIAVFIRLLEEWNAESTELDQSLINEKSYKLEKYFAVSEKLGRLNEEEKENHTEGL